MDAHSRYLEPEIGQALSRKMVFIGGPRQVGKTTLALSFLGKSADETHPAYFNWDDPGGQPAACAGSSCLRESRSSFSTRSTSTLVGAISLKGIHDTEKSKRRIIVTGSARLDYYRKGGDSLQGRYRYFRLHPFSLAKFRRRRRRATSTPCSGSVGSPNPSCAETSVSIASGSVTESSASFGTIYGTSSMFGRFRLVEQLVDLLPDRVGSPLSIKSLREDLEVDHKTVERWLSILENLYFCFRISPFGRPKIRAVKKERKLYLWDWSTVPSEDRASRTWWQASSSSTATCVEDTQGHAMELRFLRDTDKREVDFVVIRDRQSAFAVECKSGERAVSPAIRYFAERTPIPASTRCTSGTVILRGATSRCFRFTASARTSACPDGRDSAVDCAPGAGVAAGRQQPVQPEDIRMFVLNPSAMPSRSTFHLARGWDSGSARRARGPTTPAPAGGCPFPGWRREFRRLACRQPAVARRPGTRSPRRIRSDFSVCRSGLLSVMLHLRRAS